MDYKHISTFLDYCKTHKRLSSHTIRAYKNDLLQFYNSNYSSVETYVEHLTKSNIKSNTLRRKIASLKVFYSYLKYHNLVDENPFNQLRYQFRTEKILPKTIPYDILKSIFSHLEQKVPYCFQLELGFPNFVIFILKTLIFQIGLSILWEKARKNVSYF